MTISSTTTRVSYTGNGATTAFSFPYLFYANDDLTVILITTATGAETVKTITTDYTVTGAGVGAGGTVTMLTAPTAAQTLLIIREVDYDQQDFDPVDNDPFPAASIEQAVDYTVMMAQQLNEVSARSLKFPRGDSTSLTSTLPSAVTRASKALVFDASGNVGVSTDDYEDQVATVAADAAAAAASASAASGSAAAASASASSASTSASNASTSASNAATSETNAATSASNASTSASNASTSASNAATAETNAETAETNAETAQAAAELAQASAEAAAAAIFWNFDTTTTMADPGTGDLRLNNATVASVTAIAVSALVASTGNPDVSDQIVTWDDSTNTNKGTITIRKAGAPATFAVFTVSGSVTDNTTWLQIAVTHVASNGALSAGDDLYLSFARAGDKGADGTGSGDMLASAYPTLVSLEGLSLASGDILYATGADTLARLPKGSDGEVLMLASGVPDWATPGGGGGAYEFVSSATASSSTTIDFSGFEAGYDYIIGFDAIRWSAGYMEMYGRVGTGAGPTWQTTAADYYSHRLESHSTTTYPFARAGSSDHFPLWGKADANLGSSSSTTIPAGSGKIEIVNPGSTVSTSILAHIALPANDTSTELSLFGGSWDGGSAVTGFRLYTTGGNWVSGNFKLWRRKRSA